MAYLKVTNFDSIITPPPLLLKPAPEVIILQQVQSVPSQKRVLPKSVRIRQSFALPSIKFLHSHLSLVKVVLPILTALPSAGTNQ